MRKGPKFTPSTKGKIFEANSDIKLFTRRLNIRETFWKLANDDPSLLRNPSYRKVISNNDNLRKITDQIENLEPHNIKTLDNLSTEERKALKQLKENEDIIIKKADKGGSLVIMDKAYYRDHLVMKGHLESSSYQKVEKSCDVKLMKNILTHVNNYKDCLTTKEIEYLTRFNWETSNFYILPKVHKCKTILKAILNNDQSYVETISPQDLKGRPIVAGCNAPTQRLSSLLEKLLNPIVHKIKTYIKDDWHFLRTLPEYLNYKETTLYSVDITSLYTSIPHDLGIEAIKYWVEKYRQLIDERFSTTFIIESLEFILENNNFIFNGIYYNQIEGTAMGTKVAPPYACLVIAFLEECKLFPIILPRHFTSEQCLWIENNFKRYMDDGFIALLNNININLFLQCLNSMHPNINYTFEKSSTTTYRGSMAQTLNFLDINVILTEYNKVETDIFYKTTNSHDYLNYHSSHPQHTKNNIPFSLAKRILCFVTDNSKMNERLDELRKFLQNNGYPHHIIEKGIFNAKLQGPAHNKSTNNIPLITTYYTNMNYDHIISKANFLLNNTQDHELKEVFANCKLIHSQRQPKNLLKHLSSAKFTDKKHQVKKQPLITKCNDKRCKICTMYLQTNESFLLSNGKRWIVKCEMSCHSKNVLYLLKCNRCDGLQTYIGKTNNLRLRTNQHISTCRTGNGTDKFDQHVFNCSGHGNSQEPYFKLFLLMELKYEKNLLTYESHFQKLGYDTMNR